MVSGNSSGMNWGWSLGWQIRVSFCDLVYGGVGISLQTPPDGAKNVVLSFLLLVHTGGGIGNFHLVFNVKLFCPSKISIDKKKRS